MVDGLRKLALGGAALGLVLTVSVSAKEKKPAPPKDLRGQIASQPDPVWPPPPDTPRVKYIGMIRDEYDVGSVKKSPFLDALAGKRREVFTLRRPMAVTADAQGRVYVLDFMVGLVAFDLQKGETRPLSNAGGFLTENPTGIAVDESFIYAADTKKNSVSVLDFEGRVLRQLSDPKSIDWPVGLAVDPKAGLLFVGNSHGHFVSVFDRVSGKLVRTIGRRGSEPGQFNFPTFLCLLPGERIAVVDSMNFRVQILSYTGRFLKQFGSAGDRPGALWRPKGIAADSEGHLYLVDNAFQNIQVFDEEGNLLLIVGQGGGLKGEFYAPVGLSCVQDKLYVADQFNGRVQMLQYLPDPTTASPKPAPEGRR